ncbi:MAG TPA: hypothetical protein VEQ63_08725, partial [Bryobacteraceae bacterium]|nr:hypothetical protein [Bryobacteraceae bacterium]
PGMNLMSFDLYGLYQQLVLDTIGGGSTYGFNSLSPCINNAGACETSLFFDHVHPTARVHRLFGDRIAEQLLAAGSVRTLAPQTDLSEAATPEPSTAIVGIVVAGFIGWRRSSRRPSQRAA